MEHVVYLTVKKGNKGRREPVVVEHLQLEQTVLSRVTLLEPYLEAWQQPSHVCGVIWDKIKESCVKSNAGEEQDGDFWHVPGMGSCTDISRTIRFGTGAFTDICIDTVWQENGCEYGIFRFLTGMVKGSCRR